MRKIFLLLLFFIFFSLSGFAITTEQQLYEQKYQLEQQKEQIKGLEDELKKYTDDKVEDSNKRVDTINGSVDRFTGVVTILGIGLPIILFLIGWFSAKNTAKKETKEFLNEWVKTKADIDFKELVKEKLNPKLIEFETEADNKLDNKLKDFESKANSQLKQFETKYKAELNTIKQQVKTTDEKQDAERLFNKAYRLGQEKKVEEAIKIYDELIAKYKDSKLNDVQEQVAMAMLNKAATVGKVYGGEKAISAYDELIAKSKDSKFDGVRKQLAMAMQNKYEWLIIQNKSLSKEEKEWIESANLKLEDKALFGFLTIIDKAEEFLQDDEIASWQEAYKEIKDSDWSFEELKVWITNSSHSEEVKNRISGYINIFEKHLHRD